MGVIALGLMTIVGSNGDGGGGGEGAPPTTCENVAGTWSTTDVVDGRDCGNEIYTKYTTATVTQDGCNITVAISGETYSGTVNGSQINWTATWEEDGGIGTTTQSLTVSGDALTGGAAWNWSDGTDSCSGTTQISGTISN